MKAGSPLLDCCGLEPVKPTPTVPCEHQELTLSCQKRGDHTRVYQLTVQKCFPSLAGTQLDYRTPCTVTDLNQLEVIGGPQKNRVEIKAETIIAKGPCPEHDQKVFDIHPVKSYQQIKSKSNTNLTVVLAARDVKFIEHPYSLFFPHDKFLQESYSISVSSCEGHNVVGHIVVWPDIRWKVQVAAGLAEVLDENSYTKMDGIKNQSKDTQNVASKSKISFGRYKVEGSVTASWDGLKNIDLQGEFKNHVERVLKVLDLVDRVESQLSPRLQQMGGTKLKLSRPMVGVSGEWGWEEIEESPECGFAYKVKLGFQPLLGLIGTADILTWILNTGGPLGLAINRIRHFVGDDEGQDASAKMEINLSLGGEINGTLNFEKAANETRGNFSGELIGKAYLQLEGIASAKGEVLWVSAGAVLKAGGKAEFSASIDGEFDENGLPFLKGKINFDGLRVYCIASVSFEKSITTKKPKKKPNKDLKTPSNEMEGWTKKTEQKGDISKEFINDEWILWDKATLWEGKKFYFFR